MTQRKTKRKLSDINFESEGAHIALVSKEQGHGANGHHYALVMKAANYSEEFLQKASKITVEMDITEYLTRFFGVWYEDAELLARSLGFTTPGMDKAVLEQAEQALEDQEPPEQPDWESEPGDSEYEKWINYKLQSIQVMKKLYEAESIPEVLSSLTEDQYLGFLQDQVKVEKAFKIIDKQEVQKACKDKGNKKPVKKNSTDVAKATEEDNSTNASVEKDEVSTSVVKQVIKEKSMANTQVIEQTVEVELIEKSQFDSLQKALDDQKAELQKALDLVKQFEQEKKEAIAKSRKEQLEKACGDKAEVIFKACGEASDEIFADVVKALSDMQATIEKSALFQEQGASVDGNESNESNLAKVIKAKYAQKQ